MLPNKKEEKKEKKKQKQKKKTIIFLFTDRGYHTAHCFWILKDRERILNSPYNVYKQKNNIS